MTQAGRGLRCGERCICPRRPAARARQFRTPHPCQRKAFHAAHDSDCNTRCVATLFAAQAALAAKSCEELKQEIAAKIEANGVQNYTLEIVPNDQVNGRQVVGSCGGGTMKIVYERK